MVSRYNVEIMPFQSIDIQRCLKNLVGKTSPMSEFETAYILL